MTARSVGPEDTFDGYALPHGRYRARRSRGPKYFVTLGVWVLSLVAAMLVLTLIDTQVANVPTRYVCPPDCGSPPTGLPVATNPRFTAPDGSFSVSYPVAGAAYEVTTDDNGVTALWTAGDGGTLRLFSQPAQGRNARQVVEQFMQGAFPNAVTSYELPNATVGYHLGYGVVADFQPLGTANRADATRVIVVAAIKNDLALIAAAAGPFREFAPGNGPGPPSPANLQIAQDMGKYVNSFFWRGDPPR
ncbi:MAG: hypothetical protein QG655_2685 [Actinomycetota bacterium]|jgi:hypothetical protein|nr:hypothetical protein [Actinomycetota bacterium]HPY22989.1 hypothetical protein [Mycobacterium sp.]